ncbi:hypothetical protein SAMN04488568_102337 [Maricaulis salignorans]|uniref:Uncharacterized protein n=1 Tax=Maricaulis salignorans TaxID=144026 RepID=A0A1G9NG00_9PROT|nr:hypothetical protein SAMN04488568_102337 [Maricaulis salignorans]
MSKSGVDPNMAQVGWAEKASLKPLPLAFPLPPVKRDVYLWYASLGGLSSHGDFRRRSPGSTETGVPWGQAEAPLSAR